MKHKVHLNIILLLLLNSIILCQTGKDFNSKNVFDELKNSLAKDGFDTTGLTSSTWLVDKFISKHILFIIMNDVREIFNQKRNIKYYKLDDVTTIKQCVELIIKPDKDVDTNVTKFVRQLNNISGFVSLSESSQELVKKDNERLPAKFMWLRISTDTSFKENMLFDGIFKLDLFRFINYFKTTERIRFKLGPYIEYHLLVDDQNDSVSTLSGGFAGNFYWITERCLNSTIITEVNVGMSKDYKKDVSGLKGSAYIGIGFEPYKLKFLNIEKFNIIRFLLPSPVPYGFKINFLNNKYHELLSLNYLPFLGIEFKRDISSSGEIGYITYRLLRLSATINLFQRFFSLTGELQNRRVIKHNIPINKDEFVYYRGSINFNIFGNIVKSLRGLDPKIIMSIGFDYQEGENPFIPYTKQIRRELSFKLKF